MNRRSLFRRSVAVSATVLAAPLIPLAARAPTPPAPTVQVVAGLQAMGAAAHRAANGLHRITLHMGKLRFQTAVSDEMIAAAARRGG